MTKAVCHFPRCGDAKRGPRYCRRHSIKCKSCPSVVNHHGATCRSCVSAQWTSSLATWRNSVEKVISTEPVLCDVAVLGGHFMGRGKVSANPYTLTVESGPESTALFLAAFGGEVDDAEDAGMWTLTGTDAVQETLSVLHPYIWSPTGICLEQLTSVAPTEVRPLATTEENAKVVGGFLGATGSVYLSMPQTTPTVDFNEERREVLDSIRRVFPGPVVLGPYSVTTGGAKRTSYRLRYRGPAAVRFLGVVGPFISCSHKKEVARLITSACGRYRDSKLVKRIFGLVRA